MASKRKLWSNESMEAATLAVSQNNFSSSHLYDVPCETLRRRVSEQVTPGCRPGPPTILTDEELISNYIWLIWYLD
jgi:hypothetical protein